MNDEVKKSYNPFKMWGSWVSFGLAILTFDQGNSVGLNPIAWLMKYLVINSCVNSGDTYSCSLSYGLIAIFTRPIIFFLYGWAVHSFFRKLNKERPVYILAVILLIITYPIIYYFYFH